MSCLKGKCSNGNCLGGCGFVNSYDWFRGMLPPGLSEADNIYEVRFKRTRKDFFLNANALPLTPGDWVVVENVGRDGRVHEDIGEILTGGITAILQMNSKGFKIPEKFPRILRKATNKDMERLKLLREKEKKVFRRTREIIKEMQIDMKLSEVEYIGDGRKMLFYYIADERVDFRELVKVLAREFRIRVEMKQISLRHEAGLIGGYGSCGRSLCCSTFLTQFKSVDLNSARYQNLVINPAKLTGLCGRLKCCLNYELDMYLEVYSQIPNIKEIPTDVTVLVRKKVEFLTKTVWYEYKDERYKFLRLTIPKLREVEEKLKKGEEISLIELQEDITLASDVFSSGEEEVNEDLAFALETSEPEEKTAKNVGYELLQAMQTADKKTKRKKNYRKGRKKYKKRRKK